MLWGGVQIVGALLASPLLRRWYNRWGATDDEVDRALPGDDLVPRPMLGYTRAVTIEAELDEVWAWLVQIGQGRGGLYSFDALENLIGCRIQSADRILPDHQRLAVGDIVRAGPPGYPCWAVMAIDPPRHLVLLSADPTTGQVPPSTTDVPTSGYAASTWQWALEPLKAGRGTRLIARQRLACSRGQRLLWRVVEPVNFVMEREMLRGIRRRVLRRPVSRVG